MKLLVISLAGIGDTLFATPLIHELRENFPDATIDAFVMWRGSRDLLAGNPHLNRVHHHNLLAEPKTAAFTFLRSLRPERYDISINTHPQSRIHYRIVARIVGARQRLSHEYHHASWLDELLVNHSLPQDYTRHCIENNLAFLEPLGAKPRLPAHGYEIFLTPAEHAWAENFLAEYKLAGRKLLGMHVGSGGTKNLARRRWPLVRYAEVIRKLIRIRPETAVLLFGGPDEESDIARLVAEGDTGHVFHPQTKDFRQAAALVKRCDAFLSVDTALMHIAAAMKVPGQVVIETPTWNKPIEPYGNPFTLVPNPAVAGRGLDFYRYDGHGIRGTDSEIAHCMEAVTVESVFDAVVRALA